MKPKEIFHSEEDRKLLSLNSIGSIELLWSIEGRFMEELNYRRGGWSGIVLHEIRLQNGQPQRIIIKRQENHTFRSFSRPIKGIPTFWREYRNIRRLQTLGIPTIHPLFYGERESKGNIQAVMAVRFLEGYKSFDEILAEKNTNAHLDLINIINPAAMMAAKIHSLRIQHGCLYGKHVFVKPAMNSPADVRFIDLEKMHSGLSCYSVAIHDLSALFRHAPWTDDSWNLFLEAYINNSSIKKREKEFREALEEKKRIKKEGKRNESK
jgi:hypothetical protein